MAKEVEFKDYTIKVINAINDKANAVLEECAGELKSQTMQNTRTASSQTKVNWKHHVDDNKHVATIGNPLENAIWEEFGTGEHALGGKGRQGGYWVFVKGSSKKSNQSKTYTLEEAKKVVAIMRSKGLDAYYTSGKKPSRAFWNAYNSLKNPIIKRIENIFKGLG